MRARGSSKAEILDFGKSLAQAAIQLCEGNGSAAGFAWNSAGDALKKMYRRTGSNIERGTELIERLRGSAGMLVSPVATNQY